MNFDPISPGPDSHVAVSPALNDYEETVRSTNPLRAAFILSDTSDATAPVTVSGSSRCMSPNVDEHVHALVSDSITFIRSVVPIYRYFADRFDDIRN